MAPLNAEAASIPGATNAAYDTSRPPTSNVSTRAPTPMPIESR